MGLPMPFLSLVFPKEKGKREEERTTYLTFARLWGTAS